LGELLYPFNVSYAYLYYLFYGITLFKIKKCFRTVKCASLGWIIVNHCSIYPQGGWSPHWESITNAGGSAAHFYWALLKSCCGKVGTTRAPGLDFEELKSTAGSCARESVVSKAQRWQPFCPAFHMQGSCSVHLAHLCMQL